jgi:hypothetical protein
MNPWSPESHKYLATHKYNWYVVLAMEVLNLLVLLRVAGVYCLLVDVRAYQDPLLPVMALIVAATVVYFPGTAINYDWDIHLVASPHTLWLQWTAFFVTFVSWYVEITIDNGQTELNRLKHMTYAFEKP